MTPPASSEPRGDFQLVQPAPKPCDFGTLRKPAVPNCGAGLSRRGLWLLGLRLDDGLGGLGLARLGAGFARLALCLRSGLGRGGLTRLLLEHRQLHLGWVAGLVGT